MILSLLLPFSLPVFPPASSSSSILFQTEPGNVELEVKIAVRKRCHCFLFCFLFLFCFFVVVSGTVVGCTL